MKICGLAVIFLVVGAGGADDDFTYALFPIQEKVQHRVTLTYTRTLTGLSLCGWVEHKPVFVGEDSSFVTVGDKGQFRLILTQSHAFIEVLGVRSEKMKLKKQTSWYHICTTWDSVEGNYCLYRDADISTSVSGSGLAAGQLLEGISSMTIGNSTDKTSYLFAGRASLFQLYSRALDSVEVEKESCSQSCGDCSKYRLLSWNQIAAEISRTRSVYNDDESPIYLPPPSSLQVQLQGPLSARAVWKSENTAKSSTQFKWYNVRVAPANSSVKDIYTTIKQSLLLQDLKEDTVYEVEVSTQSRCGRESWSDPVSVKTMSVPGPVQDLRVLNKTNSTVTVGWTPLDDVIQYYFTVIFPTAGGSTQEYKTLDPAAVNHTFTGLLPYTWYTVKIAASNAISVGRYNQIDVETETNRVDPNLNVTLTVEIQPNYEVALSWQVSDQRETAYLYKLTIKKLSGETSKEKRNFNSPQIRDSGAEFQVDGKNSPFIEIKTSLRALTVKGLVHHAPYQISVAICPDPTSLCRIASGYRKIFVAFAEQYYYQQFYSGPGGPISQQTAQNMVLHATQNSSSLPHFSVTNITPTSFLGKLTFSNQLDGSNVTQGEMWYKLYQAQGTTFQDLLLGPSFQLSPVKPSGYCDFLVDEEQGKGNFTWPYVRQPSHVVLPCNLSHPNSTEMRSRRCDEDGWEEEADYSSCPYSPSTSGDIQRLLDTKITNVGEAVEVSKRLTEVTTGTMTTETIGMASQAISQIVSSADNPAISFNVDVAVNLAGALGNIQSLGRNQLKNENSATAAQSIVNDVETYCQNLTGDESTLVNYASSDLKLAVVKLPSKESSDIFIESNTDSEMSIDYKKKARTESQLDRISVKVPKELVKPESNVLAVIYKDKSMFQANDQGLSDDDFNIPILSLSINTVKKDSELENEVLFSLTVNDTGRRQPVCVYWDTEAQAWTTDGVLMVYSDDKNIICKTTHLTSFSALLLPAQDDYILSIISQIGTSISIVCLFATVLLLYIVRCVRECMSTKIHINFALALFLALLFFMINTNTTYPGTYCKAMAGLTHYFFLSTFCWMSVEAVGLYRAVVLVFTTSSNKTFLLGAAGVAWGVPAVLVIVLLFLQQEVYQIHPNLSVCWLSKDWMYGTFFSPLLIMVLFNCLVFFRVLWTIIKNKHSRSKGSMKPGQRLVELRIIFSIMSLLGLTWIFGVIQVSTPHIVLEYLFAITNTLQGVAVFVFYCLYNSNIRLALWRVLHGQPLNESASNSSSQQKMKKRRMSIKKAASQKLSIVKAHIDGNPFAFSFGGSPNSNGGASTLKKMDRKNWKKLKKNDIQHTNSQLNDTINSKGATVLTSTGPTSITMPTLSTCYSPASSPTDRTSKQSSSSKQSSEHLTPDPDKFDTDDVIATKNCDVGSEKDIMLDDEIVLELDKDSTLLRGSSERCSTPEESRSGSRCSSPADELNLSQTSSYEKLGEDEEKSVENNGVSV